MNEVKPHFNWAKKVMKRAQIFGVLNEGISNEELYKESNFSSKSIEVL